MDSNSTDVARDESWGACSQGALGEMTRTVAARQRSEKSKRWLNGGVVGLSLFVATVMASQIFWGEAPEVGGIAGQITCAECRQHFSAYHSLLVGKAAPGASEMTAEPADKVMTTVRGHLSYCELCQAEFRLRYPDVSLTARPYSRQRLMLVAWQPNFSVLRLRSAL